MKGRILIVDPRPAVQLRLKVILEDLGYEAVTARSSVHGQLLIERDHELFSLAIVANTSLAGAEDIATKAGRYGLLWLVVAKDSDVLPRQLQKHVLLAGADIEEIRDVVAARIAQGKQRFV